MSDAKPLTTAEVKGWRSILALATCRAALELAGWKWGAESWNAEHPVGTRVRYWPVLPPIESAPPLDTTTRSEAWELGDGTPIVKVVGRAGGVALAHIELLEGKS